MSGELESSAFKMAVQRSERIRTIGLLIIATVLLLVVIMRSVIAAGELNKLALIAAACRAYTRSGLPADKDLGTVMTRINNLLLEDLKVGTLVTMAVAVLDPAQGKVQLLSAAMDRCFYTQRRMTGSRSLTLMAFPTA